MLQTIALILLGGPLWAVCYVLWRQWTVPFRNLKGPPLDHWFFGNLLSMINLERFSTGQQQALWIKQYGPAVRYHTIFRRPELLLGDLKAIDYVFKHPELFDGKESSKETMRAIAGDNLITAGPEEHRRLRRIMLPFFGQRMIRNFHEGFMDCATAFVEKMIPMINLTEGPTQDSEMPTSSGTGGVEIDAFNYMNRITLDVIGKAGFGYSFGALTGKDSELLKAWFGMMEGFKDRSFLAMLAFTGIIGARFPIKSQRQKAVLKAREAMTNTAKMLVAEKKRTLGAEVKGAEAAADSRSDLLTGLVQASMRDDIPESQRLTEEEMFAQVPLLLLAGNITTASTLTWALIVLAQRPDIQSRLRGEILSVSSETPSQDTIMKLEYLEAFVRELLRVYPSVPTVFRQASKDCVIPLSLPIRTRNGETTDSIRVDKGNAIFVPSLVVNLSKEVWGPDAEEFRPERHLKGEDQPNEDVPSIYGNLLTFAAGERACLGYRFAITELKTVLFVMLQKLSFHEIASKPKFERYGNIGFTRMRIIGEKMVRAPMVVKLYNQDE